MNLHDSDLGDLADSILSALHDPSISDAPHHTGHIAQPQSLARGAAGISLLHSELAFTRPDHATTAHAWLTAASAGDLNGRPDAGLFYGVPALAFATSAAADSTGHYQHTLTQLDAATTALTHIRLNAAHDRIDRGELPAFAEFDVISGLTGLGAYHLLRNPHHDVTSAILSYLVRLTEPLPSTGGLPGWWTDHGPLRQPPTVYPGGHGNFGMAHGIAGPLALLALALRRGIAVDGTTDAISRICAWLDSWQQDSAVGTWWPRTVTLDEARTGQAVHHGPHRPSWCYGTPGIARAQQLAAIATGDVSRQRMAEKALAACLDDLTQLGHIIDSSLCHGAAGLLHTTWHAVNDSESDVLSDHLPKLRTLLGLHARLPPGDTGLLEGTAGVALAVLASATDTRPLSKWDSCLLLA
ncbi:lanthionine synthetase C family protein [Umezawaea sp. Da 62-37]|uniref:lanthionine synthetase C family protein n=1 Tax=Umezawaea sp. Da 62-37 TaxID=3075927 RepID=UPI0028F6CDF9|nr:lanthionine synthetase C family protein [Umezawaea sp. Da 62-37]WNV85042.1 lanthionine synthetase C family protein [Umezawaea sp. Da 62-37]